MVGTSEFSKLWLPNIHVVGVLIWGLWVMYFLMGADQPKDSSRNCSLIARAIDLTMAQLNDWGVRYSIPTIWWFQQITRQVKKFKHGIIPRIFTRHRCICQL